MYMVSPDEHGIQQAVEALRDGEIVAYPTESVYGLGVDPFNLSALERLYAVKERDTSNPVLMIIGDEAQLEPLVGSISDEAQHCMDAFWPGPLSLLFPVRAELPELLIGVHESVCIRLTAHPIAKALCEAFGGPITSTSANRSYEKPATEPSDLTLEGVRLCLDGGRADSTPSTIYDPDRGVVLREGAISRIAIHNIVQ